MAAGSTVNRRSVVALAPLPGRNRRRGVLLAAGNAPAAAPIRHLFVHNSHEVLTPMRYRALGLSICLGLLVVGSGSLSAQDGEDGKTDYEAGCGYIETATCSGQDVHVVPPTGGNKNNSHLGCMICLIGNGQPSNCHPGCLIAANPVLQAKYESLLAAATRSDFKAIVALGAELEQFVSYNPQRRSVQLMSCDGNRVVANLPVKTERAVQLVSSLRINTGSAVSVSAAPMGAHITAAGPSLPR